MKYIDQIKSSAENLIIFVLIALFLIHKFDNNNTMDKYK